MNRSAGGSVSTWVRHKWHGKSSTSRIGMVIGQPEHGTACTRIARGPRGAYELQHERALRALRGRRDGGASHERAKAIHLLLQPRGLGALLDELGAQPLQLGAGRGLDPLEEGGQ